ncbi:ABC transporter substrate-binding protein [Natrinema thermotolerans]|uniref:ABC transporter substrate-binding protein n=1 Tax=Natrinema thermotolerans TaxID=121872 RepID=A0AAF0PHJ3_9EURY|nr:ABC transporter substrate-binding protein [Natrinema thermotolerans]QCC58395.1 ABC transporter substrate-binding protein [Natrinema thermotolerans]WMT09519.1 ABC transporter substrate-binding protein [Natrinema thermotolerans]
MDPTPHADRSRRAFVATGIAAGSAAVAGCIGGIDSESTSDGDSYTVSMAPMGEVEFDSVPQDAFVTFPQYADMAVALGHGDAVTTLFAPDMSGATMNTYYDRLEGVSFEWEGLENPLAEGLSEERLYALDSDVHFLDPSYPVKNNDDWDASTVEDVADQIGPWFGNFHSGVHSEPASVYADSYEYYTLWELFERVAAVFREEERYEALAEVHADLRSQIESNLPPESERPTVARVTLGQGQFYAYHLNAPGYWQADTRPLGARDVFADRDWERDWGTVGYEAMLDADPDVILHLWGITPRYAIGNVRKRLENDSAGSQLTAVQDDRVVPGGMRYQGPLMNLFQLEMTAKQLYPERFGEWPGYESGESYPEIPADEQLFDRQRVAEIVTEGA